MFCLSVKEKANESIEKDAKYVESLEKNFLEEFFIFKLLRMLEKVNPEDLSEYIDGEDNRDCGKVYPGF